MRRQIKGNNTWISCKSEETIEPPVPAAASGASPLRIVPRFPPESKILTHRVQVLDEGSGDPKVLVLFSKNKIQRRAFDCSEDKERISSVQE